MLFVCVFLPTLRVCNDPMAPIEFPPAYGVYLGALLIAAIAFARTYRRRVYGFTALAFVYYATGCVLLAAITGDVVLALVVVLPALAGSVQLVRMFVQIEWRERTISAACMTHALIATIWTFVIASDKDALYGAYVAVVASTLLLGAAISALVADVRAERAAREPVPTARVV